MAGAVPGIALECSRVCVGRVSVRNAEFPFRSSNDGVRLCAGVQPDTSPCGMAPSCAVGHLGCEGGSECMAPGNCVMVAADTLLVETYEPT